VNGPKEYRETGNNELIAGIITAGGGHVFDRSRLEQLIPEITARKTGMVRQVIDLRPVFLLAALLLYSIEVIFRRIADLLR